MHEEPIDLSACLEAALSRGIEYALIWRSLESAAFVVDSSSYRTVRGIQINGALYNSGFGLLGPALNFLLECRMVERTKTRIAITDRGQELLDMLESMRKL